MANPHPLPSPATQFTSETRLQDPEDYCSPIRQVKQIQRLIYEATKDEKCDKRELAQLALAWERLEERKRVMRMQPAPKPVDVSKLKPKRKVTPAERLDAEPPEPTE